MDQELKEPGTADTVTGDELATLERLRPEWAVINLFMAGWVRHEIAHHLRLSEERVVSLLKTAVTSLMDQLVSPRMSGGGAAPRGHAEFAHLKAPPLTPELREWLLEQYTDEEYRAGFRDIEETGGRELKDFAHKLEKAAAPDEQRPDQK
jgi:hypothetical protein